MRIESKSAIRFALSYGEDRCINLLWKAVQTRPRHYWRGSEILVGRQSRIRHFARLFHQLDVETQGLQFANQHVERFRYTGLDGHLALDDGFVNLGAPVYVVGLGRE